jgi:hypothetical protein
MLLFIRGLCELNLRYHPLYKHLHKLLHFTNNPFSNVAGF